MELKNNADYITEAGFGEAVQAFIHRNDVVDTEVIQDILEAVAATIEDESERSHATFHRLTGFILGYEVRRREERKGNGS